MMNMIHKRYNSTEKTESMREKMEPIIKVENLTKTFTSKSGNVEAVRNVNFEVEKGDIFGIIGLSGAGKSTLVRCLNLLEKPTGGKVIVNGKDLTKLSEKELRKERQNIGMIFQHFNLLMQRNVLGNVCFPMEIAGIKKNEAKKRAYELLKIVGLEDKAAAYPAQLSGGEQQRVSIARALAKNPKLLLCDEPTGALDYNTGKAILKLLQDTCREKGMTVILITHNSAIAPMADRVIQIKNGKVSKMTVNPHPVSVETIEW